MASRLCHISLHVKLHCSGIKEEKRFPAQPPPLNPSIPHPPSASSGDVLITSTIVTSATVTKTYRWGSRRQQYYYFRRFLISTTSIRSVREVGWGSRLLLYLIAHQLDEEAARCKPANIKMSAFKTCSRWRRWFFFAWLFPLSVFISPQVKYLLVKV